MAFKIFDLAVILVILGMVAGGIGAIMLDFDQGYNLNLSTTSFESLNRINDTELLTTDISGNVDNSGIQADAASEITIFKAGFTAVKLALRLPEFFAQLIGDIYSIINENFGIPPVFATGIIALVGLVVVFGMIAAVMKIRV